MKITPPYVCSVFAVITFTAFSASTFAQQGMGVGNNNPLEMLDVSGAIKVGTDLYDVS